MQFTIEETALRAAQQDYRLRGITEVNRDITGNLLLTDGEEVQAISTCKLEEADSILQLLSTTASCMAARAAIRKGFVR